MRLRTQSRKSLTVIWLIGLTLMKGGAAGQEVENETWDTTLARGTTTDIEFTTSEGTYMSVDISPDGRWIVFDLLAHIYRIPASGGRAECLTQNSGVALNYHPRFSPDGRYIAFVSDRKGQDNLWIMDADGSNPRAVYLDKEVRVTGPRWMPDSEYLLVRHMGSDRTPRIMMYHREGGKGVELPLTRTGGGRYTGTVTQRPDWPSVSRDGKYVYFQFNATAERGFVEKDLIKGSRQIARFDMGTREIRDLTGGTVSIIGGRDRGASSGGAIAPEISPDGRWLAFARRIPGGTISFKGHVFGPRSALFLRDLETGIEKLVMDPITSDKAEGYSTLRDLPGYGWGADGKSIVLSQGGQIRRLWVASGRVDTIPFQATVRRTLSEKTRMHLSIPDEAFQARFMRWHTASPDGSRLVFQAVGKIWVMSLAAGKPVRLTSDGFKPLEFAPAWSPDGRWIAFTSWEDGKGGHLWKVGASGGNPERLTRTVGEYLKPSWGPDGSYLVLARGSGATFRGRNLADNLWYDMIRVPANGGDAQLITTANTGGSRLVVQAFIGPGERLYYMEIRESEEGQGQRGSGTQMASIELDGSTKKVHLTFPFAEQAVPSPDGRRVAFQEGDEVYVMPFPPRGAQPLHVTRKDNLLPVRRVSSRGGLFPRWRDHETLEYGSANRYVVYDLESGNLQTTEIDLRVPRRIPSGRFALTGARIITLENRTVIERGTIVVNGSRLECIGTCDTSGVDRVIDVAGKTIVPGYIDMHAHHHRSYAGMETRRGFETSIYLAYGVTTDLDPSAWSQNLFPLAELIEAGEAIGPRSYTTSDTMSRGDGPGRNEITSLEVAREEVNRRADFGATAIKQYAQPRRDQRQWVTHAARERGLMVTSEGSNLAANLGMIMDGQTGWEHPMSYAPLYSDAAKFFGKAGAVYSPTLVVGAAAAWNDEYFLQESDLWKDPKQRRFMSWRFLFPHTMRRTLRPVEHFSYPIISQGLADIIAEGGMGSLGGHGQHHGLATHWELWMYASALGPMGALEVASLHGATFLGAESDLGTIRIGKLADLVVLNSNPLDNIRNTTDILYVIKGGIIYEGESLDEIWPEERPFGDYYWVDVEMLRNDQRPVSHWDPAVTRRSP